MLNLTSGKTAENRNIYNQPKQCQWEVIKLGTTSFTVPRTRTRPLSVWPSTGQSLTILHHLLLLMFLILSSGINHSATQQTQIHDRGRLIIEIAWKPSTQVLSLLWFGCDCALWSSFSFSHSHNFIYWPHRIHSLLCIPLPWWIQGDYCVYAVCVFPRSQSQSHIS